MVMYFVSVVLIAILLIVAFMTGVWFANRTAKDAREDAEYARLRDEYYRIAGYRCAGDPKPYVPPQSQFRRVLPGMGDLDKLLKNGQRGTVMWKAGDVRE